MVRVTKLELHRTITEIMKKGDLDQLTTKKIRILCEQKYNVDLTSRKQEIDNIVMNFINKHCCNDQKVNAGEASGSSSYETDSSCSDSSCSESECSYSSDGETKKPAAATAAQNQKSKVAPAKQPVTMKKAVTTPKQPKKVMNSSNKKAAVATNTRSEKSKASATKRSINEMDDAAYARQLQAEEWNFRSRTSKKLFRNTPKKRNDKNDQEKKKKATPFRKKCLLSPALAEVLGTNEMSRPDIVQKMWSVVRERNLFDTSNKQYAICDDQLFKLFGKKRIRVIGMMKHLKNHIKDIH